MLRDFLLNCGRLEVGHLSVERQSVTPALNTDSVGNFSQDSSPQQETPVKSPTIELNELVKKPVCFEGKVAARRKWLDDYEGAAACNGWSEVLKVPYFPTFLEECAHDWFVTVGQRKVGETPEWGELRSAFIRHYLAGGDRQSLRRQVERTCQYENESAVTFIPRLLRLYQLIEPNEPEEELVEAAKDRLCGVYQEPLPLHNIYTPEELNDA